jgi:hypothetical protein
MEKKKKKKGPKKPRNFEMWQNQEFFQLKKKNGEFETQYPHQKFCHHMLNTLPSMRTKIEEKLGGKKKLGTK